MSLEPLLAIGRSEIADYVDALFLVYIILIFINVLLSWFQRIPYNRVLYGVIDFIHDTTNPYLNLFRRFLPPLGGGGFRIDISPILGIFVLFILRAVVVGLIEG
ncbi:MAG: YggT family protein [Solirubrobacterales bacterium]